MSDLFYFYIFIYSKVVLNLSFLLLLNKRYFEEGRKPNSCWSTLTLIVGNTVDQQLFGFPHSSKYLLTDVNVCGAVQYIDTAAPELQLNVCSSTIQRDFFKSRSRRHFFQGRCWPNPVPKQDFIVVPPSSNIMEVKKYTYHRCQNRILIKYESK